MDAVTSSGAHRPLPLLTLDFDELLDFLVAETATRTGADAVALRIEGPGGRPAFASLGTTSPSVAAERSPTSR